MARQAKTIREHLLMGTVPQSKNTASQFKGGRPKYPKHLSRAARAEFKRNVQLLEQRGTVTPGDFAILALQAEAYARWVSAKEQLGEEYMVETTVTDNHGQVRKVRKLNPLLKVVEAAEHRLLVLSKSLGLTPVDRDKTKLTSDRTPAKAEDVMDAFLTSGVVPVSRTTAAMPDLSQLKDEIV
jgi:P27 family predicted phage terminase small subunit